MPAPEIAFALVVFIIESDKLAVDPAPIVKAVLLPLINCEKNKFVVPVPVKDNDVVFVEEEFIELLKILYEPVPDVEKGILLITPIKNIFDALVELGVTVLIELLIKPDVMYNIAEPDDTKSVVPNVIKSAVQLEIYIKDEEFEFVIDIPVLLEQYI